MSKWNRIQLKVSTPPSLTVIPEEESCRDWTVNDSLNFKEFLDIACLIDLERSDRELAPFARSAELDRMALAHARRMASKRSVHHSVGSVVDLQAKLDSENVGENIQRGDSVLSMYRETMSSSNSINRSNILSDHFDEFGSALAFGKDGKIYCCQVFRKR